MCFYAVKIPWEPRPKASIRLGVQHYYNPSSLGMKKTGDYVRQQMLEKDIPILNGPLFVIAHFRIAVPLSLTCPKRLAQHTLPHTKRPDGDNLEKFLNDSLNGILWKDDAKIAWLLRSKTLTYDKVGSTQLYIKQMLNEKPDYTELLSFISQFIDCNDESDVPLTE